MSRQRIYNEKHRVFINSQAAYLDGNLIYDLGNISDAEPLVWLYRNMGIAYPKFFKMDRISKLGFLATELLMQKVAKEHLDKNSVATILATSDACLEIDQQFERSRAEIASPALFVYTLPNIAAGEICIRNGFKGEQMVWASDDFQEEVMLNYLDGLFAEGNTSACLAGYLNAYQNRLQANLGWYILKQNQQ